MKTETNELGMTFYFHGIWDSQPDPVSILLFTSLTSEKNQRQEAEIYAVPFSRLNRPLTERKELNKSNVWYSSSTVRSKGHISWQWSNVLRISALPQVLGGPKKSDSNFSSSLWSLFSIAAQFPKWKQIVRAWTLTQVY